MVTGGAGYIGSVVTEELLKDGHDVVVVDDLSKGHRGAVPPGVPLLTLDISNQASVSHALRQHGIDAVIHMAADSLVGESVAKPDRYYRNNVSGSLCLLNAMCESVSRYPRPIQQHPQTRTGTRNSRSNARCTGLKTAMVFVTRHCDISTRLALPNGAVSGISPNHISFHSFCRRRQGAATFSKCMVTIIRLRAEPAFETTFT